jgi:hypothetical protein
MQNRKTLISATLVQSGNSTLESVSNNSGGNLREILSHQDGNGTRGKASWHTINELKGDGADYDHYDISRRIERHQSVPLDFTQFLQGADGSMHETDQNLRCYWTAVQALDGSTPNTCGAAVSSI